MLNKLLQSLIFVAALTATALAGGVQQMPSTAPFNEPSQTVATWNAFINYLNGGAGPYTAGAAPTGISIPSLGSLCNPAAGGTPQTCNGQRGIVPFTGITVTTTGSTQTLVINNSLITAQNACNAQFITAFTAGSAVMPATVTPGAGTLTVVAVNAGTTSNAVTTGTLLFNCVQ